MNFRMIAVCLIILQMNGVSDSGGHPSLLKQWELYYQALALQNLYRQYSMFHTPIQTALVTPVQASFQRPMQAFLPAMVQAPAQTPAQMSSPIRSSIQVPVRRATTPASTERRVSSILNRDQRCNILSFGLTDFQKQQLLNAHNLYRQHVALGKQPGLPSASDMKVMIWSPEMEKESQDWANQCEFEHNPANHFAPVWLGSNLWTRRSTNDELVDYRKAVDDWYSEIQLSKYTPFLIQNFQLQPGTGHLTQILWADSVEVGCGVVKYLSSGLFKYQTLLVCTYRPGGNRIRRSMYQVGYPCTKCQRGCSPVYPGLCL